MPKTKLCDALQSLGQLASRVGFTVDEGINGEYIIRDIRTKQVVKRSLDEGEVRGYLGKLHRGDFEDLDEALNFPARGITLSAYPTKPSAQLVSEARKKLAAFFTGPVANFVPIERHAQNVEKLTGIPVLEKVYNVTQRARNAINEQIARVKRDGLAGRTYEDAMHEIAQMESKLSPKERRLATLYREYLTKEEVKNGAFLGRPLTEKEIEAGEFFTKLGVAEELPTITRRVGLIHNFLENRDRVLREIPRMRNEILEGRLPATLGPDLDRLEASAGLEKTFEDVLKALDLSGEEVIATQEVRRLLLTDEARGATQKSETIRAAALKVGNDVVEAPTHGQAFMSLTPEQQALFGERTDVFKTGSDAVEGFTTSSGRFVDRAEAAQIQGQKGLAVADDMGLTLGRPPVPKGHTIAAQKDGTFIVWKHSRGGSQKVAQGSTWMEAYGKAFSGGKVATPEVEGVNFPAVYRYATAAEAKPGFKDGRAQFASEAGLSPQAVALSNARDKIIREAFKGSGFDHERLVYAQLPVFRQFIDAGIYPGKQWESAARSSGNQALAVLGQLEEGSKLFSRRVLSGHLNPYELSPSATTVKHVENMLYRKHMDPVLPEARNVIKQLAEYDQGPGGRDSRIARFFSEYLNDVTGQPSKKFQSANATVRTMGRMLGVKMDDRIVERFVNTMVRMTSNATLPFRPALMMRNFYEGPARVAPVVGPQAWWHGVKAALGWTGEGSTVEAMKAAVERAVRNNAIDPNVLPIHASSEVFGQVGSRVGLRGTGVEQIKLKVNDLFDLGFSFYRTPDDFGRVVANEAGIFRARKAISAWRKRGGHKTVEELKRLKADSKVLTFDETIEAQFENLIRQDRDGDAANLIGKVMADEAHGLYANANHPPGWNGVGGRLLGQFGTFPIQYTQYLIEKLTRGTLKDRAEFLTIHGGLNAGIIMAGAEIWDADLSSWAMLGSVAYTGGPYAEAGISLVQLIGGSDAERSLARRNLQMMLPSFDSPQSVIFPGSYAIGDWVDAYQSNDIGQAFGEAMGFRFLNPGEKTWVDHLFGWVDEIGR